MQHENRTLPDGKRRKACCEPGKKHTGNQGGGRKRGGFDSVSRSAADGIFSAVPRTGCDAISDFA